MDTVECTSSVTVGEEGVQKIETRSYCSGWGCQTKALVGIFVGAINSKC